MGTNFKYDVTYLNVKTHKSYTLRIDADDANQALKIGKRYAGADEMVESVKFVEASAFAGIFNFFGRAAK